MRLISFFVRCSRNISYSKALVIGAIAAGIISGAGNTLLLVIINQALGRHKSGLGVIAAFGALCVVFSAARLASQVLLIRFAAGAAAELRVRLSRQVLASALRRLEQIGAHRVLAVFTDDVPGVMHALTQVPNICINLMIVMGCFAYMAWLSWFFFVLVIVTLALAIVLYHMLERRSQHFFEQARDEVNLLMKNFRALVDGHKELQLHGARRSAFLDRGIEQAAYRVAGYQVASTSNYAIAESVGGALLFVMIGLLLFAFTSFRDTNTVVLTGFVIAFLALLTPMQFLLNTIPQIAQADVGIRRIDALRDELAAPERAQETVPAFLPPSTWRRLEMVDATHTYFREKENSRFTLGPINLTFEPGSLVFITGGNGSGKTTLIKMLTGLYETEGGEIRLDGETVGAENMERYRHLFSVVFSDFYLFDELYGMRNIDGDAHKYLQLLQLDHKVSIQEGRLSTVELSQGQRKRLALLTAYLEDRPIYVFDEWAADQDPLFRNIFYYKLLPDLKERGKTVIVVSHDDRYFHLADRLIKLDYGMVEADERLLQQVAVKEISAD